MAMNYKGAKKMHVYNCFEEVNRMLKCLMQYKE